METKVRIKDNKTGKVTMLTKKDGQYYKAGKVVQLTPDQSPINYGSPLNASCSPMKKESPYMMYGKESAAMMSESPLAKYGCSKKYKKSK